MPARAVPAVSVTVPARVPVGPRGALLTARKALSLPSPKLLLFAAVPPQPVESVSVAVVLSNALVPATSPLRLADADQMSATVPATWGVAIEVPLKLL